MYSGGYTYRASRYISHEYFDGTYLRNDIGLVRVDQPIQFNNLVQTIPLTNDNNLDGYMSPVIAGWGSTVSII